MARRKPSEDMTELEDFDGGGAAEPESEGVSNASDCPLFVGARGATKNAISILKVHKLDPPGEGFKGVAPRYADEVYIARRWGNGQYRVEACTDKGVALRTANLSLDLDIEPANAPGDGSPLAGSLDMEALALQHEQHNREVDRYLVFTKDHTDKLASTNKETMAMVSATHAAAAQRDRHFYESQRDQNSGFFQSMLAQSEASHHRALQMSQENFRQTFLMQQTMAAQMLQSSQQSIALLLQGLQMGRDMETGETEPEWLKAVTVGVDGIKSLATMSRIPMKGNTLSPSPPTPALPRPAPPLSTDTEGTERLFEKSELSGIVAFKQMCDQKGVDFSALLDQAKDQVSSLPDDFEDEGEEAADEDNGEEVPETQPPHGAGDGSTDHRGAEEGVMASR